MSMAYSVLLHAPSFNSWKTTGPALPGRYWFRTPPTGCVTGGQITDGYEGTVNPPSPDNFPWLHRAERSLTQRPQARRNFPEVKFRWCLFKRTHPWKELTHRSSTVSRRFPSFSQGSKLRLLVSELDSRTTARPRKGKASLVTSTSLEGFPQCAEGPPRARGDEVSRSVCEHGGQDHGLSRGEAIALRSGFLNPKTSSDLEPPRYKHADRPT